jgi:hypothetical protein
VVVAQFEVQENFVDEINDDRNGPNDAPRNTENRHSVSFSSQVGLCKCKEIDDWRVIGDVEQALCGGDRVQKSRSSA